MNYFPRLKILYEEKIIPILMEEFGYRSLMEVPRVKKVVLNQGLGASISDKKILEHALKEITAISGQKSVTCLSKRDESGFKLRKNVPIGCKVTLRNLKMYEFIDRLITVALPRIRDFNGVKTLFDGKGNYNMGIFEQIIFPEIDIDHIKRISGMNITFVTSAKNDKEARSLLSFLGVPFKKK